MGVVKRASTWGRVSARRRGAGRAKCGRSFRTSLRAGSVGGGESPTLGKRTLCGCLDCRSVAEVGTKHLVFVPPHRPVRLRPCRNDAPKGATVARYGRRARCGGRSFDEGAKPFASGGKGAERGARSEPEARVGPLGESRASTRRKASRSIVVIALTRRWRIAPRLYGFAVRARASEHGSAKASAGALRPSTDTATRDVRGHAVWCGSLSRRAQGVSQPPWGWTTRTRSLASRAASDERSRSCHG